MRCGLLGSKRVITKGYLWVFLIKRAWAVQAILQHSVSGHLVSGRGFWAPEGINCYFFALDMTILGMAVYFVERVEWERGCFSSRLRQLCTYVVA